MIKFHFKSLEVAKAMSDKNQTALKEAGKRYRKNKMKTDNIKIVRSALEQVLSEYQAACGDANSLYCTGLSDWSPTEFKLRMERFELGMRRMKEALTALNSLVDKAALIEWLESQIFTDLRYHAEYVRAHNAQIQATINHLRGQANDGE